MTGRESYGIRVIRSPLPRNDPHRCATVMPLSLDASPHPLMPFSVRAPSPPYPCLPDSLGTGTRHGAPMRHCWVTCRPAVRIGGAPCRAACECCMRGWSQVEAVLPDERVTRLPGVGAVCGRGRCGPGRSRCSRSRPRCRCRPPTRAPSGACKRFLVNPAVTVAALWQPLLPALLRGVGRPGGARSSSIRPRTAAAPPSWWSGVVVPPPRAAAAVAGGAPAGGLAGAAARRCCRRCCAPSPRRCRPAPPPRCWPIAAWWGRQSSTARGPRGSHVVLAACAPGAGEQTRVRLGDGPEQRLAERAHRSGSARPRAGPRSSKRPGGAQGFLTIHWDRAAAGALGPLLRPPRRSRPGPRVPPARPGRGHLCTTKKAARLQPGAAASWRPWTGSSGSCWRSTWRCGGPTASACKSSARASAIATTAATGAI